MRRRSPRWAGPLGLAALLGLATIGCGGPSGPNGPNGPKAPVPKTIKADRRTAEADDLFTAGSMDPAMREALLRNIISLLENAPLSPGGQNIDIATENLNQYFKATPASSYKLSVASRPYLEDQLADFPFEVDDFESMRFELKDARHIEDCLLYHNVAARVAGPGTTLDRVRRLFDWSVRHVQLIPFDAPLPEGLIQQGLKPAPARPYDVIIRGLGSEIPGQTWAERSWVFMALCRQIGVDAAMLSYEVDGSEEPYYWTSAALVDGDAYLFDTRIGMEIPGPDGTGVATLEEAANDPNVLDRLDLPAPPIPYETDADDLGKVRVWIDSSRGYFAPKMRLLQNDLAGANRDGPPPRRRRAARRLDRRAGRPPGLGRPLGAPLGGGVPPLHRPVLRPDGAVRQLLLQPRVPPAGRPPQAAPGRPGRRQARLHPVPVPGGPGDRRPGCRAAPPQIREALDLFATYYLGLSQLEDGRPDQAVDLFEQALDLPPGTSSRGSSTPWSAWAPRRTSACSTGPGATPTGPPSTTPGATPPPSRTATSSAPTPWSSTTPSAPPRRPLRRERMSIPPTMPQPSTTPPTHPRMPTTPDCPARRRGGTPLESAASKFSAVASCHRASLSLTTDDRPLLRDGGVQ